MDKARSAPSFSSSNKSSPRKLSLSSRYGGGDCRDGVYGLCGVGCGSSVAACAGMYAGGRFLDVVGPPGESKLRSREVSSAGGACLGGGGI